MLHGYQKPLSGKKVGVVFGSFAPLHQGHLDCIMRANQAYTDAATNIMALFAQILMVKRYREQWVLWLLIDVFCIKMWWVAGNWSMVAMYIAWTANCIYGWYNWTKLNNMEVENA